MKELQSTPEREIPREYPLGMIFDMDGTLIINPGFYKGVYSTTLNDTVFEACGESGLATLAYYRNNFEGKGELTLGALGIPFSKWAEKLSQAPIGEVQPDPELVAKLRAFKGKKALFTGSPKALAYRLLTQVGFDPESDFDLIVGWEEPELSPLKWNCSPFIFRSICQRLGLEAEDIWAIGDNWESDLAPAERIGAASIQVNKSTGSPRFRFSTVTEMFNAIEEQRRIPYVVSSDIRVALAPWAQRQGFTLPSDDFFTALRQNFAAVGQEIFPGFEMVSEDEIILGLQNLLSESPYPTISLDGNYFPSEYSLELTRTVNDNLESRGLRRRPGTVSFREQLGQLNKLKEKGLTEVNLVDDVGFSGELLERVINILKKRGFTVKGVYLGVGVSEAIERIEALGIEIKSVRKYGKVIDEICERDFYPGTPQSGRTLVGIENIGASYILPFGKPNEWASIPLREAQKFSLFCIEQAIRLFSEIERISGKIVRCKDLERVPYGIPKSESRFVDELRKIINSI